MTVVGVDVSKVLFYSLVFFLPELFASRVWHIVISVLIHHQQVQL